MWGGAAAQSIALRGRLFCWRKKGRFKFCARAKFAAAPSPLISPQNLDNKFS